MNLKEKFTKVIENNKDKDWNNPVFRETLSCAFRFAVTKEIEERFFTKHGEDVSLGLATRLISSLNPKKVVKEK